MNDPILDSASLFPDRSSRVPIVKQITDNLRTLIRNGGFPAGTRLLPTREFAARIGASRNTVVAAVEQLVAEGYLVSRVGSGTFVAAGVVSPSHAPSAAKRPLPAAALRYLSVATGVKITAGGLGAFRVGVPDLNAFPLATFERLERKTRKDVLRLGYPPTAGDPGLRAALAHHLRQFRGLSVRPRDIIVVEGAQSAFQIIANVVLDPGDAVVCEDPCYSAARAAFAARGAKIVAVPIDEHGLAAADLPAARLAYVTPSHQYPLGGVMNAARRTDLLAWARTNQAYVVEDDYDSEFRYFGNQLQAIQGTDADERVIYVGTFSKVLAPGLRLGYIVAPPHLTAAFRAARAVGSLGGSTVTQSALAEFIGAGHLARHVRRQTAVYEKRASFLDRLLRELAGRSIAIGPLTGGMHLTVRIDPSVDDAAIAREALNRGVVLHPLSDECIVRTDCRGFILGYGMTPTETMRDAVAVLAALLEA